MRKTSATQKLITIPLTAHDLTITTFFATQQLLTNLSNTQDPSLLLSDVAEALHTTPQALTHLPIGSWDDNIIRAILQFSDSHIIREESTEEKISSSEPQTSEDLNGTAISGMLQDHPNNTNQTIDTETPELKDQISLLGIARHLSNLVGELSSIAKENMADKRISKEKPKPNSLAARKASKRKSKKTISNDAEKLQTIEDLLPQAIYFVHKGHKYFLLGRDVDCSIGVIPQNKMTVGDFITVKAVELDAFAKAPERDKDGRIFIDRELKAPNGKPTGKVLSDEEYKQKMHTAVLQDIDIAFNLTIRQVAVLCRRAHEALPQEISEREAFITERAMIFADAPAWIAFAIRGFFLERLLARRLTHVGSLILKGGVHHQV